MSNQLGNGQLDGKVSRGARPVRSAVTRADWVAGLRLRFWGVRGSVATAGASTASVGGNTSCVEVRCGDELIILDAGTGLRGLGAALPRGRAVDASILLSHFHWDHIQGFPFFAPAYGVGNQIDLYGPERSAGKDGNIRGAFEAQMRPPHFPVGLDTMRATLGFFPVATGQVFHIGAAKITTASACHPNGCLAYRIEHDGCSVVYATDTEHMPDGRLDENLLALARGADVLIYDAQYTDEEYAAGKRGWGHSTANEGVRLAQAAKVGQLVLFHHDPLHDDFVVARIEAETRRLFPATTAAREGLTMALGAAAVVGL